MLVEKFAISGRCLLQMKYGIENKGLYLVYRLAEDEALLGRVMI